VELDALLARMRELARPLIQASRPEASPEPGAQASDIS